MARDSFPLSSRRSRLGQAVLDPTNHKLANTPRRKENCLKTLRRAEDRFPTAAAAAAVAVAAAATITTTAAATVTEQLLQLLLPLPLLLLTTTSTNTTTITTTSASVGTSFSSMPRCCTAIVGVFPWHFPVGSCRVTHTLRSETHGLV